LFQTRKRFVNKREVFWEQITFKMGTHRVEDMRLMRKKFTGLVLTQPTVLCGFVFVFWWGQNNQQGILTSQFSGSEHI
jgi:hypothetical protein